jgi:hypothetical protein
MRKLALLAAVVWLISCYGMNAAAQTWSKGAVVATHFVGPSGVRISGGGQGDIGHGDIGMNALCQATYGPTAHMCNMDEFSHTAGVVQPPPKNPPSSALFMWIQPSVHDCLVEGSDVVCSVSDLGRVVYSLASSACAVSGPIGESAMVSYPWSTSNPSVYGWVVEVPTDQSLTPTMLLQACDSNINVACCAP